MQKEILLGTESGNMMDRPSVQDLHIQIGLLFKKCHILDKIEAPGRKYCFVSEVRLKITASPYIPRVSESRRYAEIFLVTYCY